MIGLNSRRWLVESGLRGILIVSEDGGYRYLFNFFFCIIIGGKPYFL